MTEFRKETIARLRTLIQETIAGFAEDNLTNAATVTAVLPQARRICDSEYDAVICATLRPMVRLALSRGKPTYTRAPSLIPGLELPYRIAVPPSNAMIDPDEEGEAAAGITWIVLHKASIAEGKRNVAMRRAHIAGAQTECDKVAAVVDMAAALTTDPDAIIGEVLKSPDVAAAE